MGFDAYIQEMIGYFHGQNLNEFMLDVLADGSTGEISKETLKELLEDALGREIEPAEMNSIIEELKKDEKSLLNAKKNVSSE